MALFSLFFACFAGTFGSILQLLTAADTTRGGFEYPAVNAAIERFAKRLKIDRELGEDQERTQRIEY